MISDATTEDAPRVATLLGTAFAETPQSRWLAPDDATRPSHLAHLFGPLIAHAIEYGRVGVTLGSNREMCAAAVWLPSSAPEPPMRIGPHAERWAAFLAALEAHHPREPHRHLVLLGVHPRRQGCGFGTRLLEHYHRGLPQPAYLEAETPRLVALYKGYGYRPGQAFEMPSGLPMWPMWRPVHARSTG